MDMAATAAATTKTAAATTIAGDNVGGCMTSIRFIIL